MHYLLNVNTSTTFQNTLMRILKKKKNLNPWANFEEIQLVPNSHQEIAVLDSLIDKTELCELWYLEEY